MARVDKDSVWFKLQHAFAEWLVASHVARWVTEVPDVDRAPLLYTPAGRRIQPDLLTELAHERELVWIDGKGKSDVVPYGNRQNTPRTGIDWDSLAAYREIVARTGRPCLVAFIHVAQREVRYVSVGSSLWQRGHDRGAEMAFVDYLPLSTMATWNGNLDAPQFELNSDAFLVLPPGVQMGLDGFDGAPPRRFRKGYATLPTRRPPVGVKGWPQP
jgi:hypothetical protein